MKYFIQAIILLILLSGCKNAPQAISYTGASTINLHSKQVNDDFAVFVSLPDDYEKNKGKIPVVYLLDANLYFDIVATTLKKYAEVGLLPSAILVGIGYKDLETMDSLRNRDYTFPTAIPEYEMTISGKADRFLSFIEEELIPVIDAKYPNDKTRRTLMGHSLGGYFTIYALQQNLLNKKNTFGGYIAASPSVHYNHNYLLNELEKINANDTAKAYVTFGGLEDGEENDSTMLLSNDILASMERSLKYANSINYKGEVYSNLGHMDTPLPTFVKGMQWILNKEE